MKLNNLSLCIHLYCTMDTIYPPIKSGVPYEIKQFICIVLSWSQSIHQSNLDSQMKLNNISICIHLCCICIHLYLYLYPSASVSICIYICISIHLYTICIHLYCTIMDTIMDTIYPSVKSGVPSEIKQFIHLYPSICICILYLSVSVSICIVLSWLQSIHPSNTVDISS